MGYKRNRKYLWSLVPGIITVLGNSIGSWWVVSNILFSLGLLAILDFFLPEDKSNEFDKNPLIPDTILIAHVAMQVLSISALLLSVRMERITGSQLVFAAISTGIHTGSSSIIVAHEMIHRKARIWQLLGKFLLFTAGNIYFYVDHLRVHHKWVGTLRDPATARLGESVYVFFIRSVLGQIQSSWMVEKKRLQDLGRSKWNLGNYVLMSTVLLILFGIIIFSGFGKACLMVFIIQCFVANFLLEYTNYIEHYGLTRPENVRVDAGLSWQSDKVLSRFVLIDLSRHSDHHFYASKPYHTLASHENSPVLPGGYASCIYLALIPPLWFRTIDPRIHHATEINT